MPNAVQIAMGRQIPLSAGLFMALSTDAPLLAVIDARSSASTKFISMRCTALPSAGPFINYGEGFTHSEGLFALVEFDCSLIGGQIKAEQISAAKWNKEHGAVGIEWMDLQTQLKFKAHGLYLEKQIILGLSNDAKGFPGLRDLTPYTNVLALTDTPAKYQFGRSVINAGGTTANTAQSCYAIIEGEMDVQMVLGDDVGGSMEIFRLSDIIVSNEAPDANEPNKKSFHDVQQYSGHLGLSVGGFNQMANSQVPTQYSVRRIANLTADSGKGLTDDKLSKLCRSFGVNKRPTRIITGTRSGEQLGASRQATAMNYIIGQSGDASRATFNTYPEPPDNYQGIPITYADNSIGETDAIEA